MLIKRILKKKDFFESLIISYFVVVFISIFLMGYITTHSFTRTYINEINSNNQKVIDYVNTLINESVMTVTDSLYQDIESGSSSRIFRKFTETCDYTEVDTFSMHSLLRELVAQNSELISAIHIYNDKTGDIISSQYGYKTPSNTTINRDFIDFSKELKGSRWIQTRAVRHSYSESPENLLTKVYRLYSSDNNVVLAFDIRENDLYNIISRFMPDNCNNIILANSQRSVLSHTNKNLLGTVLGDEFSETFMNASGHTEAKLDGKKHIISYSQITNSDWRILMIISASEFYPSLRKTLLWAVVIAFLSIAVAVLIAYVYSKHITEPIQRLTGRFRGEDDSTELNDVVTNIFEEFSSLNDTIEQNRRSIQRNFLICSYYKSFNSTEDMLQRSDILEHEFSHSIYLPIILNIKPDLADSDSIIHGIMNSIEQKSEIPGISSKISSEKIAVLLGTSSGISHSRTEQLLLNCLLEYNEYVSFFYIGEAIFKLSELSDAFLDILKLYEYGFFYPESRFLYYSNLRKKIENPVADFGCEFNPDLFDKENYTEKIDEFIEELLKSSLSAKDMHKELVDATHNLAQFLSHRSVKLESAGKFFENGANEDIQSFKETVKKIFCEYLEKKTTLVNDRNYIVMQEIKNYIELNYKSDVSLTAMADSLGVNSSSLSRIFKEVTGINLSDYIKDFKLSKARELLLTTSLSINEIAAELDYNTVHYFIRIFKEKYGQTPKVYRELNKD